MNHPVRIEEVVGQMYDRSPVPRFLETLGASVLWNNRSLELPDFVSELPGEKLTKPHHSIFTRGGARNLIACLIAIGGYISLNVAAGNPHNFWLMNTSLEQPERSLHAH